VQNSHHAERSGSQSFSNPLLGVPSLIAPHALQSTQTIADVPTTAPLPRQYPSSIFTTLGIIYREEGVRVLFSGVAPRVIWISLGGAFFLGVYEAAKKALEGDRIAAIERRD
jgi:hypothetical protein